jgi:hypothetical protein
LVETNQLPGLAQGIGRVPIVGIQQSGEGSQEFGVMERELALAVGPFAAAVGGVGAPVILQVQLTVPGRQSVS